MKNLHPLVLSLLLPFLLSAQTNSDTFLLKGCAKFWKNNQPVKNVEMRVDVDYTSLPDATFTGVFTTDSLCSEAEVTADLAASNKGFFIGAAKIDTFNDYRNGLSVVDLLCINRHILGLEPLSLPAQIAADANNSRSITTFDIVELRKLLLGLYTELPNSSSWKIWPPYCQFPNPANPFQGICENFPFDSLPAFENRELPLTAIKIGDVDGDYAFDGNYQPDTSLGPVNLYAPAHELIAGDTVTVPLYWQTSFHVEGIQFALRYDTAALEFLNIQAGAGGLDSWGVFPEGLLTHMSLFFGFSATDTLAWLKFMVKTGGPLSERLAFDNTVIPARHTNGNCGILGKIDLDFSGLSSLEPLENPVSLSPPMPNPFRDQTSLNLVLDRAQQVQIKVLDITGRRTFFQSGNYQPGNHQIEIPADAVPALGLGFYRVSVGERLFVGKLVRY